MRSGIRENKRLSCPLDLPLFIVTKNGEDEKLEKGVPREREQGIVSLSNGVFVHKSVCRFN